VPLTVRGGGAQRQADAFAPAGVSPMLRGSSIRATSPLAPRMAAVDDKTGRAALATAACAMPACIVPLRTAARRLRARRGPCSGARTVHDGTQLVVHAVLVLTGLSRLGMAWGECRGARVLQQRGVQSVEQNLQ